MAYTTTPLGQKLADPATIQPFETAQVNANALLLEQHIADLEADTGWVNFGTGFTVAANWTLIKATYRKVGRTVTVDMLLTYTGPTVTVSTTQGNFTDIPIGTINAADLRPLSSFSAPIALAQMGVTEWFGRIDGNGGGVVMSHGLPSMQLVNPTNIAVRGSYIAES